MRTLKFLPILLALFIYGCGANYHVRQAEKHILKAQAKGAVWKEIIKTDTIVKDTTIFIAGESLDESFDFDPGRIDSVTIEKEKIITKVIVDCKNKKGSVAVDCPDRIVKVPQKYYVNRRITRTLKSGPSNFQVISGSIFFFVLGALVLMLKKYFDDRNGK